MKLRRLSVIGAAVAVAAAGLAVSTGSADAQAANPDVAVGADMLRFEPPATLPDIGTTQVRIANVGSATPPFVRLSFQTGGMIDFVATVVQGVSCSVSSEVNGRNVAICIVPPGYLDPGESLVVNATVQIGSPPVPADPDEPPDLKVAVVTIGDPDGATVIVPIGR